jgi:phosphatidylglycerophosphate synthase
VDLDARATYLMKAGGIFAAIMLIVIARVHAHHPFPRFGPANQITTVRGLLVALVAGLIGEPPQPIVAVSLALIATMLDGVDGWFARRTRMASAFGARFDVETDALLILVLAILTWRYGKAGPWVMASGLLRYAFVAAGWILPWMRRPLEPALRAKIICIVQIGGLITALLPAIVPPVSSLVAAVSLAALCYSFFIDTRWLWLEAV